MKPEVGKRYVHYKNGNEYIVLAIGRHSETLEELIIYEGQYDSDKFGHHPVWARPRDMFEEQVFHEGALVPRFKCIDA